MNKILGVLLSALFSLQAYAALEEEIPLTIHLGYQALNGYSSFFVSGYQITTDSSPQSRVNLHSRDIRPGESINPPISIHLQEGEHNTNFSLTVFLTLTPSQPTIIPTSQSNVEIAVTSALNLEVIGSPDSGVDMINRWEIISSISATTTHAGPRTTIQIDDTTDLGYSYHMGPAVQFLELTIDDLTSPFQSIPVASGFAMGEF